jgi:arylsulfatase A-like enzyme
MLQLDWCVGEVLSKLDKLRLSDNTLVIFSSDNGPVLDDGYVDEANEKLGKHDPNGIYRAGKYSMYEGGTRVPMLVRWPARISAGQVSNALFGQVDLASSFASMLDAKIPDGAFPDGRNELDTLLGKDVQGRPHLVHEAGGLALRVASWKFIPTIKVREGLGPWTTTMIDAPGALFDLANDPTEQKNIASEHPEKILEMQMLLKSIRERN